MNDVSIKPPYFQVDKYQYSEEELIKELKTNIGLRLRDILHYQKNLSARFCKKYLIFNDKYSNGDADSCIGLSMVLKKQPHLKEEDFEDLSSDDSDSK